MKRIALSLASFLTALAVQGVEAQDAHYWTNQFGTRAQLLSGVVVGGIQDLSTTFYNPGGLAGLNQPSLLFSAEAYDFTSVSIENGAGTGKDLGSLQLRRSPGIFAAQFSFSWLGEHKLAYSVLNRHDYRFHADAQKIDRRDALSAIPGLENFMGEAILIQDVREHWGGFSWAYPLSSRVGFGASTYLAFRNQKSRFQSITQTVNSTARDGSSVVLIEDFQYWNLRAIGKIGLALDLRPFSLGLALTSPSLGLFGSGSSLTSTSFVSVDLDGDGNRESGLAATNQQGLDSSYKSPLSFATGLEYRKGPAAIHFTAEWFDQVDVTNVLPGEDLVNPSTGSIFRTSVTQRARSVINWGVGIECAAREGVDLYAGFITDRSSWAPGGESEVSSTGWDIFHVTAGGAFKLRLIEFTLGGGFSWGNDVAARVLDLQNASESNQLLGELGESKVKYRRIKIILGFTVPI